MPASSPAPSSPSPSPDHHARSPPYLHHHHHPPDDRRNLVHLVFFIAGVSMLLPWNALITATSYFSFKFRGGAHAGNFLNYFTFTSTLVNLLGLGMALVLQKKDSMWRNVQVGMFGNVLVFVFLATTARVAIGDADSFFYIMLAFVVLSAASVGWMQNAVFGIAAQFPAQYTTSIMSGQGAAGVAVAVADMVVNVAALSHGIMTDDAKLWSGFNYFLFATGELRPVANLSVVADVLRQIAPYATAVLFVFVVTLAVFPSVTAFVAPVAADAPEMYRQTFTGIHYLVYNVGDWVGRTLPALPGVTLRGFRPTLTQTKRPFAVRNKALIVWFALQRVLLVPAFSFCNVVAGDGHSDPLFGDEAFFAFMLVLAVTNGWTGSLAMMEAPTQVSPENRSLAGTLMSFVLTSGLFVGSMVSFVVTYKLTGRSVF